MVDTQCPARDALSEWRGLQDCLSRESIEGRIKRRQAATIVYQYRSAHSHDCILYPQLSPLNDRGIIPGLHWRAPLALSSSLNDSALVPPRGFPSALLESGLVFVVRARISLNSISFYRRSASEIPVDPARCDATPTCVPVYLLAVCVSSCISQVWLATGCVNACGSRSRRCVRRDCGQCINPARM